MWLCGHVHVFLRTLADVRVWNTPLWIVSASVHGLFDWIHSTGLSVWFFSNCLLPNGFCRVDVTEVQIAIVIMYVMTAFGGVSLWETRVRHSPSLTDICFTLSLWSFFLIMFMNSLPNHLHWKSPLWPVTAWKKTLHVYFWLVAKLLIFPISLK